jgi:hypothetical protein
LVEAKYAYFTNVNNYTTNVNFSATNDFDTTSWQTGSPNTDIPLGCCPGVTASSYTSGSATNAGCPSASGAAPVGQYSTVNLNSSNKNLH